MKTFFSIQIVILLSFTALQARNDSTRTLPTLTGTQKGFDNIQVEEYVSLESFEGSIAGAQLSCEQTANGGIGVCGGSCEEDVGENQGATLSLKCAGFINDYVPKCLEEIGCFNSSAFCGAGGHAKRTINSPKGKSSTPSRHSTGDALDVFGVRCKSRSGKKMDLNFSSAAHKDPIQGERYNKFLKCWRDQVDVYKAENNIRVGGAISCQGSEKPNNHLHNDHLHLSCPVPRKNVANL